MNASLSAARLECRKAVVKEQLQRLLYLLKYSEVHSGMEAESGFEGERVEITTKLHFG